jgi:pyrroline-5-carboxylate reductase
MANVGFIGTGEIAAAMVRGLTGQGHAIRVSERGSAMSAELAVFEDVEIAGNQGVIDGSDIVVLCLLRDVAHDVLPSLDFRADQRVISVMVDVSLSALEVLCAPVQAIEITIPLPFVATGGCPLPAFPSAVVVGELFSANNPVFAVKTEAGLNAHFAATAMASVAFSQAQRASEWLGELTGDTQAAEQYLVAMLGGFFSGLPQDGQGQLRAALMALNTEGGLNQTLRAHMEQGGVLDDLTDGLDGFRERLGLPEKR